MSLEGKTPEEIAALAALADDVLSKPDTAGVFQRLVKKNNPGVSMPLVELEDRASAAFKQQNEQIAALQARLAQQDAEKSANTLFEALRDTGTASNRNDFSELVKYAAENGYQTTEAGLKRAAAARRQERESAEPTPVSLGNGLFNLNAKPDEVKPFFANPKSHAVGMAHQAMDELIRMRNQGRRAH